jgi:exodeoxyribonuclease VIII
MKAVLFKHPYAKSLLTNGEVEASYYGELDIGSEKPISIRFRPDNVKHKKRLVVDLKTTANASKDEFPRSAAKFGYHIQAAFYSDMMELATGEELGYDFFFVAQEKTPPFAFNIFQASPQFLSVGRYEYEILLMLYAWCVENDKWPGYQVFCQNKFGVHDLSLPPYAIKELEYFIHKL